ncbi:hypothetical protein C4K37_3105 [Pseudomonas chlororaphis subsp. piscium]|nr:hypothetical protein C4K37_3105 [Pseudomonas chlororaphis subsp. piscium]AZC44041.1 hypothetical protein C4K36_3116 [Pseudomonas chlororaphis subsp. piscium]
MLLCLPDAGKNVGLITALNDRADKSSLTLESILFCTAMKASTRRKPPWAKDSSARAG